LRCRAASRVATVASVGLALVGATAAAAGAAPVPAPAAGASGAPLFEWNMPSRYGATDARGRVVETQPYEVRSGPWKVYLRVREPACTPDAEHRWSDGTGRRLRPRQLGRCRFLLRVARQGPRTVRLRATVGGRRLSESRRIVVRDRLIVAIGDSVGSGEGVPEAASFFAGAPWQSARCHRSARAGFARAAAQIEADDGRSSVTFVHLACSGAGVRVGLLEPYAGAVAPRDEPPLEPQMDVVERIAGERRIDALLISAGANDVHFSGIASFCGAVGSDDCFAQPLPRRFGGDGVRSPRQKLLDDFALLRDEYRRLAKRVAAVVPPSRVYLSEYFDPTHDANGQTCERFFGSIGRVEVEQARDRILRPLNAMVGAVARRNGWNLVDEIGPAFRRHGYCAGRHAWVNTLGDSLRDLGGITARHRGTLHPNRAGHEVVGAFVAADLERDLFPNRDFPVRPFPQPLDPDEDDGLPTALVVALVCAAILLSPAIGALAFSVGPLILVGFLLWLWRESVTPLLLGFLLGGLLLLALRRRSDGELSRSGRLLLAATGPFMSLVRTLRPLLLPLLVVVAIGAAGKPLLLQVVLCAALVLIAWFGIVRPEKERSEAEAGRSEEDRRRWDRSLAMRIAVPSLVAIGLGALLVALVRLLGGLVNPYFEAIGDVASGLLLVALVIWAAAIVLRLVSYTTTPLRAILAFDLGLALLVLLMAFGVVPANEAVKDAWPQLATVFGIAALALLAIETVGAVLAASRGERREAPSGRRPWRSYAAGAGLSAAAVAAVVLAVATIYGLVDAAGEGKPLTPPDEEVADARPLSGSDAGGGLELARRYAPVLAFHPDERWTPTRVEPYLAAARLSGPRGEDREVRSLADLDRPCPEFGQSKCYRLSIECDTGERRGRRGPARQLCEGTTREEDRLYRSGAVYFRVLEKGSVPEGEPPGAFAAVGPFRDRLRTLIQYWYFYPYNEWRAPLFAGLLVQRHESDWEGVTIGLDGEDRPLFVADSAHCGGSWRNWRDVEASTRLPGPRTHPLVAVALGSHANYPSAEEERSPDWASCSKKLPSGTATAISYASNIRDRTEYGWLWYPPAEGWIEASATEPPMSFPGVWGADGEIVLRNFQARLLASEGAPATPSLQGLWRDPVRTIFCGSYEPRECD
jgi:GDSL-like Lipase/Acylhydrolase family